ncbi:hypothetical protein F0324_15510 [Enterobacter kobei]|nr:hypothetical protein F0324_15510 [Enterobacter kobei]
MWLMKTLLTSGCTNQRGAGQRLKNYLYKIIVSLCSHACQAQHQYDFFPVYIACAHQSTYPHKCLQLNLHVQYHQHQDIHADVFDHSSHARFLPGTSHSH